MKNVTGQGNRQAQYERRYSARRHWLNSIKISSGCKDCGCSGPAEVLTFDHVRGEKKFGIGTSWNQGKQALEEEIAKCEIVCANCHAKRTYAQYEEPEFVPFKKIPRLSREIVCSEKIDGSNGIVWVDGEGDVWAGSRNRWLPRGGEKNDNFGFAAWVSEHEEEFKAFGPSVWRGEWWGRGIQRGYGLQDRRFSLFNTDLEEFPACCSLVPVLYRGIFDTRVIDRELTVLKAGGSVAAPGFNDPEGLVVFHISAKIYFKKTIKDDEAPKSQIK